MTNFYPKPIKKIIYKKIFLRLFVFVMLSFLSIALIVAFGDVIFSELYKSVEFRCSCYVFAVFLSAVITKVYRIFTDRSYCGEVKKVKVVTVTDSSSTVHPSLESLYRKNVIYLAVETKKGKEVYKKVFQSPVKLGVDCDRYKVGDKILHLHGTNVTVVLPTPADTHCSCAICGGANNIENEKCAHCGTHLIKFI